MPNCKKHRIEIAPQLSEEEHAKQELRKVFPKKIEELNIAFDTSTNFTGYAITIDGKLFDFGRIKTTPKKDYNNYAERMLKGSKESIDTLAHVFFLFFKRLAEFATIAFEGKPTEYIEKINIVFEATIMPNGGKKGFFTMTTLAKMMLYLGAISKEIQSIIEATAWPFLEKIEYKFSKATEWQNRLYIGQGDRKSTKAESIKQAKEFIKNSGLIVPEDLTDDEADAINITRVADVMRDNLFTGRQLKTSKNKLLKTIPRDIAKAKGFMANMESKAVAKKMKQVKDVYYFRSEEFIPTTPAEKSKKTKALKFDLEKFNKKNIFEFMTPREQEKYKDYSNKIEQLNKTKANILEARKLGGKVK